MRFFFCLKQVQRLKVSWLHTSTKTSIECPLPHPLENVARFPFTKIYPGLKFRSGFKCPVERYIPVTDPTQATARLVIVLVSRIQKSGTGGNNFVKWKGTFRDNRTGQSGPPSKLVPNIPVGMVRSM